MGLTPATISMVMEGMCTVLKSENGESDTTASTAKVEEAVGAKKPDSNKPKYEPIKTPGYIKDPIERKKAEAKVLAAIKARVEVNKANAKELTRADLNNMIALQKV